MKIAITGKGGVGKTTLACLLAHIYAEEGRTVLAIDADPAANLAASLGFPAELTAQITPIAEMDELIYERTGARPGTIGGFFTMNPRVDDIPERFSAVYRGIRFLQLGTIKQGGHGCICPESALLKSLVTHLLVARRDVVILDMEAGVEHLGRGTAQAVDAFIIVVEPGQRSIQTAHQIYRLSQDIHIPRCYLVGNKVRNDEDQAFIAGRGPHVPVLGYLPADPRVVEADLRGQTVFDTVPPLVEAARRIVTALGEAEIREV
jgi:CO dehydrogenase maturation factor